jgi:hypothetical protein
MPVRKPAERKGVQHKEEIRRIWEETGKDPDKERAHETGDDCPLAEIGPIDIRAGRMLVRQGKMRAQLCPQFWALVLLVVRRK